MVDKVILVIRAEKGAEVMEAIPLSDGVGQDTRVRMTFVRMDLDVEVVGKHFLGIACCQEQLEDKEEKDTNDVLLADKLITACFLVSTEGGGTLA